MNDAAQHMHTALASRVRRRMLDAIVSASDPVDTRWIATQLELHVTTVRFHLDRLEAAHLVRRVAAPNAPRRGRPRVWYVAVSAVVDDDEQHDSVHGDDQPGGDQHRDERSRAAMIELLAGMLAERDADRGRSAALEAGRAWGRATATAAAGSRAAGEPLAPGDERATLLGTLTAIGFEPAPRGDEIDLHACPFRGAAAEHPQIVCAVHSGLVRELTGGDASTARLLPFVEPTRCVVVLGAHAERGTA